MPFVVAKQLKPALSVGQVVQEPAIVPPRTRVIVTASGANAPVATSPASRVRPASQPATADAPAVSDNVKYDVGYGRPPKQTQFRKGQSGNPKGRPKGAKAFNTIVRETMTAKLRIRTAQGRKNVTHVQALMMQAIESALKGSRHDRHELMRYYRDAVPEEPQEIASAGPASTVQPEDVDAHDRAILEHLRATILADQGDVR